MAIANCYPGRIIQIGKLISCLVIHNINVPYPTAPKISVLRFIASCWEIALVEVALQWGEAPILPCAYGFRVLNPG